MPAYHCHAIICDMGGDATTTIFSSISRCYYNIFIADEPLEGFPQLPVDRCRSGGVYMGDKDELRDYVETMGTETTIEIEVYRDYESSSSFLLYMFVRRRAGWSLWKLSMPKTLPYGALDTAMYPYPSPCDWHFAETRTYGGVYTFDEYESYASSSDTSDESMGGGIFGCL